MDHVLGRDDGGELALEEIERRARGANGEAALPLRDWLALAEAWRIAQALRDARGNRSAAARTLGIGRRTLYTKIDKLGLVPAWRISRPGANDRYASELSRSTRGEVG
jgi:DNA-binding NtrC family response regulator